MDPTVATEETFLYGRRPVNIFTFTSMAMRMSAYWSASVVDNKQIHLRTHVLTLAFIFGQFSVGNVGHPSCSFPSRLSF